MKFYKISGGEQVGPNLYTVPFVTYSTGEIVVDCADNPLTMSDAVERAQEWPELMGELIELRNFKKRILQDVGKENE